ncbi:MAG: hypothetical protein WC712_11100 [Candidatus Brocadiia bacterium]
MYIKVEGEFIRSEAVRNLTHPQFRILIALTVRCVELHSHRIAYMSLNQLHSSIADECGGVNIATFRASLRALQAAGFVKPGSESGLRTVELPGVLESHPQIKWSGRPGMAVGAIANTRADCQAGAVAFPGTAKTHQPNKAAGENPPCADEDSLFEDGISLSADETSLAKDEKSLTPFDVTPPMDSTCDFSAETLSSERTESIESLRAKKAGDPASGRALLRPEAGGFEPISAGHRTQDAGPISAAEGSTEGSALIHTSKSCCEEAPAGLAEGPASWRALLRPEAGGFDPRSAGHRTPDASREREASFSRSLDAALDALLGEDLERGGVYTVLSTLYGKGLTGKEVLKAMRLDQARLGGAMIASGRHRADKPPIAAFRYYAFGSVPPPDWAMAEYASLQRRQLVMADR